MAGICRITRILNDAKISKLSLEIKTQPVIPTAIQDGAHPGGVRKLTAEDCPKGILPKEFLWSFGKSRQLNISTIFTDFSSISVRKARAGFAGTER